MAEILQSLLTARDVCEILRCSLALVYKLAEREQLPCIRWECPGDGTEKPRTMIRFERTDIEKFIQENKK